MKTPRPVSFFAAILLAMLLAACATTPTATVSVATATPQAYPVAASPTAGATSTAYPTLAAPTETLPPTATATFLRSATPSPSTTAFITAFPGAPAIALAIGQSVMVSANPPVPSRLREQPGVQANLVGLLQPGENLTMVEGPRCADGYTWWKVHSATGNTGWTVEGDNTGYWLVTPTPVSGATPSPTPASSTSVWEMWFFGFSCDSMNLCSGPGMPYHYYSVMSDGSGLKELQITGFPPQPTLPANAPPMLGTPLVTSPNGSQILYWAKDLRLVVASTTTGEAKAVFDTRPDDSFVGPYCWSSDGKTIIFLKTGRPYLKKTPVVVSVSSDGSNLHSLFTLPGLESLFGGGTCAPDGRSIVVVVPVSDESGEANRKAGLYRVDLDTGNWRQILPNFSVGEVRVVPAQR